MEDAIVLTLNILKSPQWKLDPHHCITRNGGSFKRPKLGGVWVAGDMSSKGTVGVPSSSPFSRHVLLLRCATIGPKPQGHQS